jgi:hypothetical protein
MKKIMKVAFAAAALGAALVFAGCAGSASADTTDSGSGTGTGTGSGTTDTTGLWSKFDGADCQIWGSTFTAAESGDGSGWIFTVGSAGWWGGCFCNSGSVAPTDTGVITFDMSKVAKISFDVKGSAVGSFWASTSDAAAKTANQTAIPLTTDWVNKSFTVSGTSAKDYGVLDIGGGDLSTTTTAGYEVYIKNIAFWDASGNEIVPTRNE